MQPEHDNKRCLHTNNLLIAVAVQGSTFHISSIFLKKPKLPPNSIQGLVRYKTVCIVMSHLELPEPKLPPNLIQDFFQ